MTTKDLLEQGLNELENGNNVEAQKKIKIAFDADVDDSYQDICEVIYKRELLENDAIAKKFKTLYSKNIIQEEKEDKIIINNSNHNTNVNKNFSAFGNPKNKWIALTLCIFLGAFGAHYFYEGKAGKGFLYLFTMGLFGIGWIIDIIGYLGKPNPYYVKY